MSDLLDDLQRSGVASIRARMKRPKGPVAPKPAKRGTPEMDAQKPVVSWLRKAGCVVSRNINELKANEKDSIKRARFWKALELSGATKGFPDLTAILPDGRTVYIEMKAPKGAMSNRQDDLHAALRARGAVVVMGRDIWSVQAALAEQGVVIERDGLTRAAPVQPLAGAR